MNIFPIKLQIPSLMENKSNEVGVQMLISDLTYAHSQAQEWSSRHKLRLICTLRKFYHTSAGHECQGVLWKIYIFILYIWWETTTKTSH